MIYELFIFVLPESLVPVTWLDNSTVIVRMNEDEALIGPNGGYGWNTPTDVVLQVFGTVNRYGQDLWHVRAQALEDARASRRELIDEAALCVPRADYIPALRVGAA